MILLTHIFIFLPDTLFLLTGCWKSYSAIKCSIFPIFTEVPLFAFAGYSRRLNEVVKVLVFILLTCLDYFLGSKVPKNILRNYLICYFCIFYTFC